MDGSNYTDLNGESIVEIKKTLANIPDDAAKKAYLLAFAQNSFAKNLQDAGLSVYEGSLDSNGRADIAAVDWNNSTLSKFGVDVSLSHFDADAMGMTVKISADDFKSDLIYLRSKGANIKDIALKYGDNSQNWVNIFSEDNVVQTFRNQLLADEIKKLSLEIDIPNESAISIWKKAIELAGDAGVETVTALARWQKSLIDAFPDLLDGLPDNLVNAGRTVVGQYAQYFDDTLGLFKFNGNVASYSAKITGAAAGVLLGVLDGVAEYKKAGGFTEEFAAWLAITAGTSIVAIPVIGALASAAIAASPVWGTVGVVSFAVGGFYYGVRSVAQNLLEAYADEPDSLIYKSAGNVLIEYGDNTPADIARYNPPLSNGNTRPGQEGDISIKKYIDESANSGKVYNIISNDGDLGMTFCIAEVANDNGYEMERVA